MNEQKKVAETYENFSSNMDDMLTKYPSREIKNMDMVFFPIHEHFYLICYNLKNPAYEIIDNIKRVGDVKIYGRIPSILHSHFCNYLQKKGRQNLAKTIRKLRPNCLQMSWQTEDNSTDCGIFLMRHMETYKGDSRTWESGLRTEQCGQFKQVFKLRTKYNNAILTSHINEKRGEIINEAQKLFKKAAQESLMKVECTKVRTAEPTNKEKQDSVKKKSVTFAENLNTRFREA